MLGRERADERARERGASLVVPEGAGDTADREVPTRHRTPASTTGIERRTGIGFNPGYEKEEEE